MNETKTDTARGRIERYTRWVIRNRWWVVLGALLVAMATGTGMSKLGLANDYRVFFSEDNPDLNAFEAVENIYTKNDNVLFVVKPREGEVFTAANLEVIRSLTEDAWQIPFSTRVDAITNFQHTWAYGDELIVEDLVGRGEITPDVVERARRVSLAEPLLVGRLIAHDASTTGVNVRISLRGEAVDELAQTVAYARGLVAEYSEAHPELEIQVGGLSMLNWAFAEAPMRDLPVVMPLMFLTFMITIVLFLRSGTGLVATLGVIGFSTAAALGIAGHMGIFLDPTSASAPTIILTLAVADSIHVLVSLLQSMRQGNPKLDALVEAMRVNVKPVFLTSLTTVVGFLTLNFSDSPPFRLLGNLTSIGVIFAWIFSMTLLPALVAILPMKERRASGGWVSAWLDRFSDMMVARHRPILAGMAVASVGLSVAITTLEVNDHFLEYFAPSLEIRQASDFTLDNLTGFYAATFSLEAGGSQEVSDPQYLAKVDEFADWLDARPNVAHVNSFTRAMKRLNMNMNADDPAEYRLPTGQEVGAQYLLLYELSLPYGLDVNDQIDLDKSSLRVDVTFGDVDVKVVEREAGISLRKSRWDNDLATRYGLRVSPGVSEGCKPYYPLGLRQKRRDLEARPQPAPAPKTSREASECLIPYRLVTVRAPRRHKALHRDLLGAVAGLPEDRRPSASPAKSRAPSRRPSTAGSPSRPRSSFARSPTPRAPAGCRPALGRPGTAHNSAAARTIGRAVTAARLLGWLMSLTPRPPLQPIGIVA